MGRESRGVIKSLHTMNVFVTTYKAKVNSCSNRARSHCWLYRHVQRIHDSFITIQDCGLNKVRHIQAIWQKER